MQLLKSIFAYNIFFLNDPSFSNRDLFLNVIQGTYGKEKLLELLQANKSI